MLAVLPALGAVAVGGCEQDGAAPASSSADPPARARTEPARDEARPSPTRADDGGASASKAESPRYLIETEEESYETFVDIHPRDADTPGWHLRLTEPSLQLKWNRERPRPAQVDTLAAMLHQLQNEHPTALENSKLRIELSPHAYPEYAARLARHAVDDPKWRHIAAGPLQHPGSARQRALQGYIAETTRTHDLHPELDAIFASGGGSPHLDGVEKCLDARPSKRHEMGRWLLERDIEAPYALPLGCLMAWYELR